MVSNWAMSFLSPGVAVMETVLVASFNPSFWVETVLLVMKGLVRSALGAEPSACGRKPGVKRSISWVLLPLSWIQSKTAGQSTAWPGEGRGGDNE